MSVRFLDLARVNAEIQDELHAACSRVLRSGRYLLGPELEAFEAEYAAFVGADHCVGVGSGLDALVLTLRALGVGRGDEVVVPGHTFVATWTAVLALGAVPVPVDPDPATCLVTAEGVRQALSERTRAVVPVHLYGQPVDLPAVRAVAAEHGVPVLEDAAQAHGARWDDVPVGTGGTAAWSFYPGKNLGALGDGGAVTTDDADLAARLRSLRNYGSVQKYVHDEQGWNSRLDELQSAVLRVKLPLLSTWNDRRTAQAATYDAGLADTGLELPVVAPGARSAWHLYVVRSARRDELQAALAARGIETLIHYPTPPHLQRATAGVPARPLPVTERLAERVLSLPVGPHLGETCADEVVEAVRACSAAVGT